MQHQEEFQDVHPPGSLLQETWRDAAVAQTAAYAKGRNEHGVIIDLKAVVTYKRPGDSLHNLTYGNGRPCSLAYHLVPLDEQGRLVGYQTKLDEAGIRLYSELGRIGEGLGLRWGGNWDRDHDPLERGENDLAHFEKVVGPLSLVKAALAQGEDLNFISGKMA